LAKHGNLRLFHPDFPDGNYGLKAGRFIPEERVFVESNVQAVLKTDASRALESQKKRLYENCREFESVMISYMMKSMRESIMRSEEPGNAMSMFEDMLAGQVSKEISHTSALGVGEMLYSQLEPLVKVPVSKEADLSAAGAQSVVRQTQAKDGGDD
jgi:Rod binding domain-containing protein